MSGEDLTDVAQAWIRIYHAKENSKERDENFWAFNALSKFCDTDPEKCFEVIEIIRGLDHSNDVLANLAAGPLEDLLAKHGEQFIDRFEKFAKSDVQLRRLLGAVWQNDISDSIWKRLQLIAGPSW